ncbi:MAG: transcription antitermination factor NusB [Alphaproteobacteria bacterium]|nr:transcription antitermination factor NusB [Alphaproteobacteria bacterium]
MTGLPAVGRQGARLGAVQALYQIDMAGGAPKAVAQEFLEHRLIEFVGKRKRPTADADLFRLVVEGAGGAKGALDEALGAVLPGEWPLKRVQPVIRAILRAAAFELRECPDVPARAVLQEYIDVAKAFFTRGPEIKFINGVLNQLARASRAEELAHAAVQKKKQPLRRRKAR